jgi:hypothetical protein
VCCIISALPPSHCCRSATAAAVLPRCHRCAAGTAALPQLLCYHRATTVLLPSCRHCHHAAVTTAAAAAKQLLLWPSCCRRCCLNCEIGLMMKKTDFEIFQLSQVFQLGVKFLNGGICSIFNALVYLSLNCIHLQSLQ